MTTLLINIFISIRYAISIKVGWVRASLLGVRLGRGARVSRHAKIKGAAFLGNVEISASVTIGRGTYINSGIVWSGHIGDWCSIAYNVLIGPTEHRLDYWTMSPFYAKELGESPDVTTRDVKPPIIEDGVWLGANVVVLRGVHIGKNAVVAAGAVVVRDIPENEIWGGVPAQFIRKRAAFMPVRGTKKT